MEYFFRLCSEYGVELPSELIHTGIFGRAASTFLSTGGDQILKTHTPFGRRVTALLLCFALMVSMMTAWAASIQDGVKTAAMSLGHRETVLKTKTRRS